ncbi:MAG: hypothetical protein ACXWFI_08140 [Methylobacter sp.]
MNINEKIQVVLVSVFISFLLNILSNRLVCFLDDQRKIKKFKTNVSLFCSKLQAAIVNSKLTPDLDTIINQLLIDYSLIVNDKNLYQDFNKIYGIYTFFKNDGYNSIQQRSEKDLDTISEILKKHKL